jgi:hypothetical protein
LGRTGAGSAAHREGAGSDIGVTVFSLVWPKQPLRSSRNAVQTGIHLFNLFTPILFGHTFSMPPEDGFMTFEEQAIFSVIMEH